MTELYIALVSAGIPAIVTLITHFFSQRTSKMHSAKQSILQMMMEDVIAVEILHKPPVNYKIFIMNMMFIIKMVEIVIWI